MKLIDYLRSRFGSKKTAITLEDIERYYSHQASEFNLTELALYTTINLIARSIAKSDFVTVKSGKEYHGAEYYAWNYRPNRHETKIEFITKFVASLILQNEALIFETADGQMFVADGFSKTEYAVFDDKFSNISAHGYSFNKTYTSSEVIYLKYNNFAVRNLLQNMASTYEELMTSASDRYNKSVGHKGVLKISNMATNDTDFQEKFSALMNDRFKTYFEAKNAVLPLFDGYDYSEPSTDAQKTTNSEINDLEKLKNEIFANVGNALHVPPALIAGTASQLSDCMDAFIGNAVDPIANMLEQAITNAKYGVSEYVKGNYMLIDTTTVRHIDAISQANNLDKAIASGTLTPAKAQQYCNMLPCSEDWANKYWMTKNYQTAEVALRGGDD